MLWQMSCENAPCLVIGWEADAWPRRREVDVGLAAGPGWLGQELCNRICKQHLCSYS